MQPQGCGQAIVVLDTEIEILEEPQERQVADDGDGQREFLRATPRRALAKDLDGLCPTPTELPRYEQPADVVDHCRCEHQKDKIRIRPAVEDIREQRQQQVFRLARRRIINQQHQRQEIEDKQVRTEHHA